jgi:AraC-like DNA-binding protein
MKSATESFYAEAMQRVIEHIASHLDEALALETLARRRVYPRSTFTACFAAWWGRPRPSWCAGYHRAGAVVRAARCHDGIPVPRRPRDHAGG